MKIKKIVTLFAFFLLLNCGFEPIYSKKKLDENFNFTISTIGFSGENKINQNIKNNLINYIDVEEKTIKYDLIINSGIEKKTTSKNKKGNPEMFSMAVTINVEVYEFDKLKNKTIFNDNFEYKNKSNKFELKQYEASIQKNLSSNISRKIIQYLHSIK